jgi:predicted small lipoprotein YifL
LDFMGTRVTGQNGSAAAKLALVGAAALLLVLGGCGRKGGLDLPPTANGAEPAYAPPQAAPPGSSPNTAPAFNPLGPLDQSATDEKPTAPRGAKRRIILDPILD